MPLLVPLNLELKGQLRNYFVPFISLLNEGDYMGISI